MSIIQTQRGGNVTESKLFPLQGGAYSLNDKGGSLAELSTYTPSDEEKTIRAMIIRHFGFGYLTMQTPRVEFNDLNVLGRMTVDQMSFNVYQPNNGDPLPGDLINSWKSNAIRPIVRNKCYSIVAHATARLIYPQIFAQNDQDEEDKDAAIVMRELMNFATDECYAPQSLRRTLTALTEPASIGYSEYCEVYRTVKREKVGGKWKTEEVLDDSYSGFQSITVPVNELYIENIYEADIQKQGWLIWRKVISYSTAEVKYKKLYKNFQYVKPGVQTIYNDANDSFYQVYDPNMRTEDVEEIVYWNKSLDLKIVMVNGIMLTDADNPNPRVDKRYPFDKFGYEIIKPNFFYYKSLAFKLQQDAKIVNSLYSMILDGTYLQIMPPMINLGGEEIGSDVIIPGGTVNFSDKDADLRPITTTARGNSLQSGFQAMGKVEESLDDTAKDAEVPNSKMTAYQMSRIEQQKAINLGPFLKMIGEYVKQYGELLVGDILQYMTIVDVTKITGSSELVYKTFLIPDKQGKGTKKIKFDANLPTNLNDDQKLDESYKVLKEQGGPTAKGSIYKVNPKVFRDLKFKCRLSPDILNPMSDETEKAFLLEEYDRAIMNPLLDQEEVTKDFLLEAYPKSSKDPDKYIKKQDMAPMPGMMPGMGGPTMPAAGNSPLNAMQGNSLPQSMPAAKV